MIRGIPDRMPVRPPERVTQRMEAGPAVAAAVSPAQAAKDAKLRDVAGQLEGVFVQQLFKAMRDTVPQQEGIVSGGQGEDIFTSLLDAHVAAETPKHWQGGIADSLYRQLHAISVSSPATAASTPPDSSAL